MKILKKDLKNKEIKIQITDEEDLWHLSHILDSGDIVKGATERKIKIGNEDNFKVVRKKVYLSLNAEKIEYVPENNALRILGKITEGPEDVSLGSHHSFNLETDDSISIIKESWPSYVLKRIDDSSKPRSKTLIVLFDREEAIFAYLKGRGYEKISEFKGDVKKKNEEKHAGKDFFKELAKKIVEQQKQQNYDKILLGSPSFWKEYLEKELPPELKNKIIKVNVSSVDETAIAEVLKDPAITKTFENQRLVQELKIVDDIMLHIKKDSAFYGFKEALEKINNGAAELVVVSENFLKKEKELEKYKEIDYLLKTAESMNAEIIILTHKETMNKVDSLGGIAGITRWKI